MANQTDYAVVIGISHYKSLEKLEGPIEDAKEFMQWLISPEGGDLPQENCFLIESSSNPIRPLQDDIDDKLAMIYEKGSQSGFRRLYFYFAGHGLGAGWNENALCLPGWSVIKKNSALSSSEYLKLFMESGYFKEVFFFLDCCRNRKTSTRPLPPTLGFEHAQNASCMCFVAYATEFNNAAYEAEHWDGIKSAVRGHFTKALMQGLKGAASNKEGLITTGSIKGFLKTKVEEIAKTHNQQQSVSFEDSFTTEGIIIGAPANTKFITLELTFNSSGNITLEGPDLTMIQQGHSSTGPWKLELEKGIYTLTNTNTGNTGYIRIDGTINPVKFNF